MELKHLIIFKGFSVARNCFIRESAPLTILRFQLINQKFHEYFEPCYNPVLFLIVFYFNLMI